MGERPNGSSAKTRASETSVPGSVYDSAAGISSAEPGRAADLEPGQLAGGVLEKRALVHDRHERADSVGFTHQEEYIQFLGWCNQDKEAADFLVCLFRMSHALDDIQDKEGGDMLALLMRFVNDSVIGMPMNNFFLRHRLVLQPVMLCSLMNWYVSAKWEKKGPEHKHFAFVLRESLDQIIHLVAYLCGGIDHAMAVAENMMEFYHIKHGEDFLSWSK